MLYCTVLYCISCTTGLWFTFKIKWYVIHSQLVWGIKATLTWPVMSITLIFLFFNFLTEATRNLSACLAKFGVFIRNWSACFQKASFLNMRVLTVPSFIIGPYSAEARVTIRTVAANTNGRKNDSVVWPCKIKRLLLGQYYPSFGLARVPLQAKPICFAFHLHFTPFCPYVRAAVRILFRTDCAIG